MYPIIFSYKSIMINSYGLMLALAFFLAFLLLERELKLKNRDPELANTILLTVIPSAIIGAKIFHIIDYPHLFLKDPMGMIFSGSGLSVLGGFILSFITCIIVIKRKNESILEIFDIASPSMALGYAIGRFGCHASGDSCYGITTSSIFGTALPNGSSPTTAEVYPAPLFESMFSFLVLALLLQLRKKEMASGKLFFVYLILMGIPRFFIEFIRTNPPVALGFTQAQFIALTFMLIGFTAFFITGKKIEKI